MSAIALVIPQEYYNKDPQSSELGRSIISSSIVLFDKLGFEQFTFKKLAEEINSTEASIYRYFDNKLSLLLYLTTWYWIWMDYVIEFNTHHIKDSKKRLSEVLKLLCHAVEIDDTIQIAGVKQSSLKRVVMSESDKTYLTKQVDEINSLGLFREFKKLCHKLATLVNEINPQYKHAHALVSTVMEASHQQAFFALHLPSLTEVNKDSNRESIEAQVYRFVHDLVNKAIS